MHSRITGLNKEIRMVSREIRHLERILRKEKRLIAAQSPIGKKVKTGVVAGEADKRRKFASYLGAGSFQTIAQYKFKSDLVRRRRLLFGGIIIIVVLIMVLIYHFFV
ncbi:MAG: hypothetical protein RAO92_05760 [Candidatus Euphemobacter frigidus]|nr:hypothetical protein [Candidatus Euphemobacter frigidus]MDP8275890.1 hypothetical protein [Candidatus Euphemobacter frigidus]